MGFLIEILTESDGKTRLYPTRRDMISEEELLKTHSCEMYNYVKSTLRYEIKVPVKKSQMMAPDFDSFLESINKLGKDKSSETSVVEDSHDVISPV